MMQKLHNVLHSLFGVIAIESEMFPYAKALMLNKDGSPRHPLYIKADVEPITYKYTYPFFQ